MASATILSSTCFHRLKGYIETNISLIRRSPILHQNFKAFFCRTLILIMSGTLGFWIQEFLFTVDPVRGSSWNPKKSPPLQRLAFTSTGLFVLGTLSLSMPCILNLFMWITRYPVHMGFSFTRLKARLCIPEICVRMVQNMI